MAGIEKKLFYHLLQLLGKSGFLKCNLHLGSLTATTANSHRGGSQDYFRRSIESNACAVILAHHQTSGNLTPSEADIKDMIAAGKFLHIPVLDHIIITSETYYSFADEGLLWPFFGSFHLSHHRPVLEKLTSGKKLFRRNYSQFF